MDAAFIWNLSKLGRIGSRRLQFDDDFADRLNYQYTGVLLFLFIGLIGVRQYVGKPIQCWIPQEFTRGWEEYAENYCWVANTYFAPVQDRLPPVPDRRELLLVYYQWAPIVMAAQALLFYLPCLTWRLSMAHSGFNLHRILSMAAETNEMVPETAKKTVSVLAHYIRSCIQRQRVDEPRFSRLGAYSRLANDKAVNGFSGKLVTAVHTMNENGPELNTNGTNKEREHCALGSMNKGKTTEKPEEVSVRPGVPSGVIPIPEVNSHGRTRKPAPPPPSQPPSFPSSDFKNSSVQSIVDLSKPPSKQKTSEKKIVVRVDKTVGHGSHASKSTAKSSLKGKKTLSNSIFPRCGRKYGNFLVHLYIAVKLCYLLNVVGQIYLMQSFIGTKYTSYGARVLIDLIQGREWHQSGHFPRVTFCDLEAKKLGKNHIYTLQCVLPLNMFLEKIYIFLWFWHVAIAMVTLLSLLVWLYRIFASHSRMHFVQSYLKPENSVPLHSAVLEKFVNSYLGLDGVFIIRLIGTNCGGLLACDLVNELWLGYTDPKLMVKLPSEDKYSRKCGCEQTGDGTVQECRMFHTVIIPESYRHMLRPFNSHQLNTDSVRNGHADTGCHMCQMVQQDIVCQTSGPLVNPMHQLPFNGNNDLEKFSVLSHRQLCTPPDSNSPLPSSLRNSNGDDIV
uniref:Innexin n=1 Tax=Cryptocotyle lingua TaxID=66766 RepID=A0A7U0TJ32_9TREM|nr:innexin 4 [Cryptocotyle lingua]